MYEDVTFQTKRSWNIKLWKRLIEECWVLHSGSLLDTKRSLADGAVEDQEQKILWKVMDTDGYWWIVVSLVWRDFGTENSEPG